MGMRCYCHHVPGRLRVKIPGLQGEPAEAERVETVLRAIPGVTGVRGNPLTGSVVVLYDPDHTAQDRILNILQDQGLFDASLAITHEEQVRAAVAEFGMRLGRAALGWAVGKSLDASGLSLLAALL